MRETTKALGWWTISGEDLLNLLRRAAVGEDPDMVYAEAYANSDHQRVAPPTRFHLAPQACTDPGCHLDHFTTRLEDG